MGVDKGPIESRADFVKRLQEVREQAGRNLEWAKGKQKEDYDSRRIQVEYPVGYLVLLHVPAVKKGRRKKLTSQWKGPYLIMGRRNANNYLLRSYDNERDIRTVHVERIKKYISGIHPTGELEVEEVLEVRRKERTDHREFKVKWRGKTDRYNTWVDEKDLHAPAEIAKFERRELERSTHEPAREEITATSNGPSDKLPVDTAEEQLEEISTVDKGSFNDEDDTRANFEDVAAVEKESPTPEKEAPEEAPGPASNTRRSTRIAKPTYTNKGLARFNEEIEVPAPRKPRSKPLNTSRTK